MRGEQFPRRADGRHHISEHGEQRPRGVVRCLRISEDQNGSLKTKVGDLDSAPLDSSASAEQFQQQVQELQVKANKLQDDLATIQMQSNGGPADAVIGAFNQKADALSASLTEAKDGAQEQVGPKITAAQQELKTVYSSVTTAMDKLCPASGATPEATTGEP